MTTQSSYRIEKRHLWGDPHYGRTTVLLLNGEPVFEGLGVWGRRELVRSYEGQKARGLL